jgi:hypothetical protein
MDIIKQALRLSLYCHLLTLLLDFPRSRDRFRVCDRPDVCSIHRCSISSLPETKIFHDGTCRRGRITRFHFSPDHAQQPYQRKTRLCKWCPCECWIDQLSAFHCMSPDANQASTATKGCQLHSCSPEFGGRSCLYLCVCMVSGTYLLT